MLSRVMITWENSRHFETPVLFSPPKDVCETSAESHSDDMSLPRPWVLLLFGWEFASTNQKHYPGWGSDARERRVISIEVHRISALVPQMSIRGETSGNFGKWWPFFFRLFNVKKKFWYSTWVCGFAWLCQTGKKVNLEWNKPTLLPFSPVK